MVRGFAIFGILVVNVGMIGIPIYVELAGETWFPGTADRLAQLLIRFLAQGKFYFMFSFLFGLGFALQAERAERRGVAFGTLYRRRLLSLMLIGLLHAFLIWMGDILVSYAVLGFVLLSFRGRKLTTLLVWALGLLLSSALIMGALVVLIEVARRDPGAAAELDRAFAAQRVQHRWLAQLSVQAYGAGSFGEIMAQRALDVVHLYAITLFRATDFLGMFLLGAYVGRRGPLQKPVEHLPLIRRVFHWGLSLGLTGNLVFAVVMSSVQPRVPSLLTLIATTAYGLGAPALSLAYVAGLALLFQRPTWRRRLGPLAPVGRMALSNYLLQSLVCTTLFYSYGLGLYGRIGPALGLGLSGVIFLAQIPLSQWWLRRFRFGPVEWLWRSLTYGALQPLRA